MNRLRMIFVLALGMLLVAVPIGADGEPVIEHPVPAWCRDTVSIAQRAEARRLAIPVGYEHPTTGIRMVLVPRGTFLMGSPATEAGRSADEGPQRRVRIEPFYISVTELTNAQVRRLCTAHRSPALFDGEQQPAVNLTHAQAVVIGDMLSRGQPGRAYRLPSEAEWEYACRAGSVTRYSHGDDERRLGERAWHAANSARLSHPVGTLKPNAWGLFDMHGNVLEWCLDAYTPSHAVAPTDGRPRLPALKDAAVAPRVARGGSWISPPLTHRSAARSSLLPTVEHGNLGLRIVRSVSDE